VKGSLMEMAVSLPEGNENGNGGYERDDAGGGGCDKGVAGEDNSAAGASDGNREGHEEPAGLDRALDRALDRGTTPDRENVLATTGAVQKAPTTPVKVETALTAHLALFLSKRTASGNFRLCGPHDMLPLYMAVFGIPKTELEDERFVSRVRREGVGSMVPKALRDPLRAPCGTPCGGRRGMVVRVVGRRSREKGRG
jgi:hypothetical protein